MARHPYIAVPNLHVVKALQSLHSRDLVNLQYNWRHFYYTLNDKVRCLVFCFVIAACSSVVLRPPNSPHQCRSQKKLTA